MDIESICKRMMDEGRYNDIQEAIERVFRRCNMEADVGSISPYVNRFGRRSIVVKMNIKCDVTYVTDYKAYDDYDTSEERCDMDIEGVLYEDLIEGLTYDEILSKLIDTCVDDVDEEMDRESDRLSEWSDYDE